MRKNVLIIFALIMLSACHNRQTQAESAGAALADSTEVMAPKETDSMASHPKNYRLTGTIGEDKASIVLDSAGVYSEYYYDNGDRVVGCYPETKLQLTFISNGKPTEFLINKKELEKIIDGATLKNMTFTSCHYLETTGNSCYFNCLMCVPETDICASIIVSIDILTREISYQIDEEDYEDD